MTKIIITTLPEIISWDTSLGNRLWCSLAPSLLPMLFLAILFIGSCRPTLRGAGEAASVPTNLSRSVGRHASMTLRFDLNGHAHK